MTMRDARLRSGVWSALLRSGLRAFALLRIGLLSVGLLAAGCGWQPDPPPSFPKEAFDGTGDLMARCMAYASQSYCEAEIWGGNTR